MLRTTVHGSNPRRLAIARLLLGIAVLTPLVVNGRPASAQEPGQLPAARNPMRLQCQAQRNRLRRQPVLRAAPLSSFPPSIRTAAIGRKATDMSPMGHERQRSAPIVSMEAAS